MTALFCRPLPFTVVSANQSTIAPAVNANLNVASMVWRSTNTNVNIIIDLGTGASYDTVALIGTNLRASDTIRIQTGTTNTGTGGYDSGTAAAWSGSKPASFTSKVLRRLPATRTDRYMRIDIVATGHPEGVTSVQRLVIGKAITTLGIDYGAEQQIIDPSIITSSGGEDMINEIATRIAWKFSASFVAASSWQIDWLDFLATVGKVTPILFVPNLEDATSLQSEAIFGRIKNTANGKATGNTIRTVELVIEAQSR